MNTFYYYNRKYFEGAARKLYPTDAPLVLSWMEIAYDDLAGDLAFVKQSPSLMDRRILIAGMFLAFIKVLERRGESFETIRTACLEVAYELVRPRNAVHRQLKLLSGRMIGTAVGNFLVRQVQKRTSVAHPDGFAVKILTGKEETLGSGYGVDILECGICKLYARQQAPAYAKILCEVDHITTALAGLQMIRTGTIATGAKKCDFRYKKLAP